RVTGDANLSYSVVATKNSALDTEANDTLATAQDISTTNKVLGAIASPATVVPAILTTVETNSQNSLPFSGMGVTSTRYQQIYSSSEFGQGGIIDALRFRRSSSQASFTSTPITLNVTLGYAATTVATASSTFANNIGSGTITVYSG